MLSELNEEERQQLMRLMGRVIIGTSRLLAETKNPAEAPLPGTLAPASFYEPES